MALDQNINRIKFLRTTVAGRKPALADLQDGELALNMTDRVLYTRNGNNIVDVGFGLGGNVNGSINATGELASTKVVTRNPNNSAANISVDWVNDEPRLRIGGSNVGSASDFLIAGSSDFERMRLTSAGAMTIPSTMTANSFVGIGSGLTQLNASMLATGTVPTARLSGTYAIDVTSASKLTTPRTINNIQFDGTSNILTPANEFVLPLDARGISKPSDFVGRRWYSTFARKSDLESGASSTLYGDMLVTNGWDDSSGGYVNALFIPKVAGGSNRKNILHYSAAFGALAWNAPRELAYTDDDITGNSDSATRLKSSRFFSAGATQYYRVATLSIPYSGGVGIVYLNGGQGFNSLPQQSASYTLTVKRGNTATSASLVVETADTNFVNSSEFFLKYVSDGNWEIWANIVQYTTFYAHTLSDKNTSIELLFDSGTATKPSPVAVAYMRQFALLQSNVASATKLQNARTINGVSFDGTANIVIEDSTKLNLSGGTLTGDLVGRTPNAFTSLSAIGTGASGAPFRTGDVSLGNVSSDRYMPLLKGSNISSSGYRSNISFGMYRASNDWSNSGAYVAVGGNDSYPTEALVYKAGGVIGTTNTNGFVFESNAKFNYPTTFKSTITVEDNGSNFQKLIQMSNVTGGGYLAVGNTGSDKGYVELGTIDDVTTSIYVRKRNSSNAVLATQVLMDENHNAQFVGNLTAANGLAVGSTASANGYGIGLYGGNAGTATALPSYGLAFAGTSTFGTYDNSISPNDWATYFTMTGPITRGWIFKNGDAPSSSNVASLSSGGVFACNIIQLQGSIIRGGLNSSPHHYIDIGKDGSDRQIFGSYLGKYHFRRTSNNSDGVVFDNGNITATGRLSLTGGITAGEYSIDGNSLDPMIYAPIPYAKTTAPAGYLLMMGQAISAATYPKLYALYGANLPDMRGMFIRGWDNGRGIDSGRGILTTQADAIQNITGSLGSIRRYTNNTAENLTGAFWADGAMGNASITGAGGTGYPSIGFDASRVARTASETRPYNIAWNYIVKAG